MPNEDLKYDPLARYLRDQAVTASSVTLSFEQIEGMIGAKLPASAYDHRAWWGNEKDTTIHPQKKAWLSAGYLVDVVRQARGLGQVRFKRK